MRVRIEFYDVDFGNWISKGEFDLLNCKDVLKFSELILNLKSVAEFRVVKIED